LISAGLPASLSVLVQRAEHRNRVPDPNGIRRDFLTADCDGEREERTDDDRERGGHTAKPTDSSHEGADAESRRREEENDVRGPVLGYVDLTDLTKPQRNCRRGHYESEPIFNGAPRIRLDSVMRQPER